MQSLLNSEGYQHFNKPVNTNIHSDYLLVIENPMDFQTVRSKIEATQKTDRDKEDLFYQNTHEFI